MEYSSAFDSEKYLTLQKQNILDRVKMFDKLYIEFGGKLTNDTHAARVLPGFLPDLKLRLLESLNQDMEVILCINANDIESGRKRADTGITYADEVKNLATTLRKRGIAVDNVVITLFDGQSGVEEYQHELKAIGIKSYLTPFTPGYPEDLDTIVSPKGYGANPFVETTKPIVIVSAPGANSGKLATALSQLYHEHLRGIHAGYAKLETFPVWNLPISHPINIAYEAATADIEDKNEIDPFHLERFGEKAVNYNRDIDAFPILQKILGKIMGRDIYYSPTQMGMNAVGYCIRDDLTVQEAAVKEIYRRYNEAIAKGKIREVEFIAPRLSMASAIYRAGLKWHVKCE